MSKFYRGQVVIANRTRNTKDGPGKHYLSVGSKYVVNDIRVWKCGCSSRVLVDVGIRGNQIKHNCVKCNKNTFYDDIVWMGEFCFDAVETEQFVAVNLAESTQQIPISAN